jgi:hypothetical protein
MRRRLAPDWTLSSRWAGHGSRGSASLVSVAGEFVHGHAPWTHFVTLTWLAEAPPHRVRANLHAFLRGVAVYVATGHVPFAIGAGHQQRDVFHAHLLLALPAPVPRAGKDMCMLWRAQTGAHANASDTTPRALQVPTWSVTTNGTSTLRARGRASAGASQGARRRREPGERSSVPTTLAGLVCRDRRQSV